jgi:hypothetical protein
MGVKAEDYGDFLRSIFQGEPNHFGAALQRHRRAGQLENRDQRWYLPSLPPSCKPCLSPDG